MNEGTWKWGVSGKYLVITRGLIKKPSKIYSKKNLVVFFVINLQNFLRNN